MSNPGVSKEGALHFFSYSGGGVCDPDIAGDWTFQHEDHQFSFLCPIRVAEAGWRPIPQFGRDRFVELYPSADKVHDLFVFSANPAIKDDGTPAIVLSTGPAVHDGLPRDTFPVLIQGPEWSEHTRFAEKALARALEIIRVETGQWWAGRSSESLTGNQHLLFQMDRGALYASPIPTCRQTRPFEGTRRLSSSMWQATIEAVRDNHRPTPSETLLSDSIYFYLLGDFRVSLVTLATCFESARDMAGDRLSYRFKGTDLIRHLSRDIQKATGRNLMDDDDEAFDFVSKVWIARGNLAHGRSLLWRGEDRFGDEVAENFFKPAKRVLTWLNSIGRSEVGSGG